METATEMKMDVEAKTKWVSALRSGEYEQGQSALHLEGGGYCCLGVLLETQGIPSTIGEDGWHEYHFDMDYPDSGGFGGCPPSEYTNSLGIPSKEIGHLISMNDGQGKTFDEIADYIEEYL